MAEVIINASPPPVADDDNAVVEGTTDNQKSMSLGHLHDVLNNKWIRWEGTADGKAKVETTPAAGSSQDVHLIDTNGLDMDVVEEIALPANTRGLMIAGKDLSGVTHFPTVTPDTQDGKDRLEIVGKVSISAPQAPPAATPQTIDASIPLDVSSGGSGEETEFAIPDGEIFTVQSITFGSEGDPNERGNKIEITYVDFSAVEHIISRIYLTGFTDQIFPDTEISRDSTSLLGNGIAGQGLIRVRRERLGGGSSEIDVVVRGFTQ